MPGNQMSPDGIRIKAYLESLGPEEFAHINHAEYIKATRHKVAKSLFVNRKASRRKELNLPALPQKPIPDAKAGGLRKIIENILQQQREKGVTGQEFAAKSNISYTLIKHILYTPKNTIHPDTALRLARAAGVIPDVFKPYLSADLRGGPRIPKQKKSSSRNQGDTYTIPCPHCEGNGQIQVRKV